MKALFTHGVIGIVLLLAFWFFLPFDTLAHQSLAIVPTESVCPTPGAEPGGPYFQAKDLFHLVNHLIQTVVLVATAVATLMFAYAGFLYVTASARSENLTQAKNIFTKVLLGFVIILLAWIIVDLILTTLTPYKNGFGFWADIQCGETPTLQDAAGGTTGGVSTSGEDVTTINNSNNSGEGPQPDLDVLSQSLAQQLTPTHQSAQVGESTSLATQIPEGATFESGLAILRENSNDSSVDTNTVHLYVEKEGEGKWMLVNPLPATNEKTAVTNAAALDKALIENTDADRISVVFGRQRTLNPTDVGLAVVVESQYGATVPLTYTTVNEEGTWTYQLSDKTLQEFSASQQSINDASYDFLRRSPRVAQELFKINFGGSKYTSKENFYTDISNGKFGPRAQRGYEGVQEAVENATFYRTLSDAEKENNPETLNYIFQEIGVEVQAQ